MLIKIRKKKKNINFSLRKFDRNVYLHDTCLNINYTIRISTITPITHLQCTIRKDCIINAEHPRVRHEIAITLAKCYSRFSTKARNRILC